MQLPKIKCFKSTGITTNHSFFVLSKGDNSGKPLASPCANCFIVTCTNDLEKEYWYWLTWGMWQSKLFHHYLIGSVIPFIRICDYTTALLQFCRIDAIDEEQMNNTIYTIKQLEECEAQALRKIKLLQEAKQAIFIKLLKRN